MKRSTPRLHPSSQARPSPTLLGGWHHGPLLTKAPPNQVPSKHMRPLWTKPLTLLGLTKVKCVGMASGRVPRPCPGVLGPGPCSMTTWNRLLASLSLCCPSYLGSIRFKKYPVPTYAPGAPQSPVSSKLDTLQEKNNRPMRQIRAIQNRSDPVQSAS